MHPVAQFVTDFADQAVVIPIALGLGIAFHMTGRRRQALIWSATVIIALVVVVVAKLYFSACGQNVFGGDVQSPSGHTAAAGVVYGGLVAMMFGRHIWSITAILAIVGTVAASRVMLGAHTVAEAALGALIGLIGAVVIASFRTSGELKRPSAFILVPILTMMMLLHGLHLPAEAAIRGIATDTWPLSLCH